MSDLVQISLEHQKYLQPRSIHEYAEIDTNVNEKNVDTTIVSTVRLPRRSVQPVQFWTLAPVPRIISISDLRLVLLIVREIETRWYLQSLLDACLDFFLPSSITTKSPPLPLEMATSTFHKIAAMLRPGHGHATHSPPTKSKLASLTSTLTSSKEQKSRLEKNTAGVDAAPGRPSDSDNSSWPSSPLVDAPHSFDIVEAAVQVPRTPSSPQPEEEDASCSSIFRRDSEYFTAGLFDAAGGAGAGDQTRESILSATTPGPVESPSSEDPPLEFMVDSSSPLSSVTDLDPFPSARSTAVHTPLHSDEEEGAQDLDEWGARGREGFELYHSPSPIISFSSSSSHVPFSPPSDLSATLSDDIDSPDYNVSNLTHAALARARVRSYAVKKAARQASRQPPPKMTDEEKIDMSVRMRYMRLGILSGLGQSSPLRKCWTSDEWLSEDEHSLDFIEEEDEEMESLDAHQTQLEMGVFEVDEEDDFLEPITDIQSFWKEKNLNNGHGQHVSFAIGTKPGQYTLT